MENHGYLKRKHIDFCLCHKIKIYPECSAKSDIFQFNSFEYLSKRFRERDVQKTGRVRLLLETFEYNESWHFVRNLLFINIETRNCLKTFAYKYFV